jgi:transcriptional regulator with XRE-family HTH domain
MAQEPNFDEVIRVIHTVPWLVIEKRRRNNLSLRDVQRQSGVSFSTIQRLESLNGNMRVDTLLALLRWVKE